MASSSPSPRARLSYERRPKLLKDFLRDDPYSCSSNDFGSSPRKLCKSTSQNLSNFQYGSRVRSNNKLTSSPLLRRSRSSRAATATISAITKVINIVKLLPFASVKSPSIFPRSISRKLSRRGNDNRDMNKEQHTVSVKVKDILRWKSFRDLVDEKSTPLDRCTTTSTATSSTTTSSKRSSWCDSDFTAEDLPSWCGENGDKVGSKNMLEEGVGGYNMRASQGTSKEELCFDENEQHSPVSVLESPFQEEMVVSFHRSVANLASKRKSMHIQRLEDLESLAEGNTSFKEEEAQGHDDEIEEKAMQLLSHFKETNKLLMEDCEINFMDELLFDFFLHELSTTSTIENLQKYPESENLIKEAKSWINGEYIEEFEWEMEDKREAYIRDMDRIVRWNKFEEERQELVLDLEFELLNDLVHQVLEDVFSS